MRKLMPKSRVARAASLALVLLLVASVAFAAFRFWEGVVVVDVPEPLKVWDNGTEVPTGGVWGIEIYPGQTKSVPFRITNDSPACLTVTGYVWNVPTGLDVTWTNLGHIPGGGHIDVILSATAAGCMPSGGPFNVSFRLERASPPP